MPRFQPQIALHQDLRTTLGIDACPTISSAADIAFCFSTMKQLSKEVMVVGALDCKSRLLRCDILSVGTAERLCMRIGDAFHPAIATGGTSIFLVHNHPSGSLVPSQEDIALTQEVAKAGLLLGYTLVDHVIIAGRGYRSLVCAKTLSKYARDFVVSGTLRAEAAEQSLACVTWRCVACGTSNLHTLSGIGVGCMAVTCSSCSNFRWLHPKA